MNSPAREASIVIPVYNKWELTRACLKSLAATIDPARVEVIVVDNASSDVTSRACEYLGGKLFGSSFHYIRNEINRNYSGASNQGAQAASGDYLIFLNNDTIVTPGWYEPLLEDFATYPTIAGTGPLLVYPEKGFGGELVQHLGVIVNPFFTFFHLYQHTPVASPLAAQRRFFQAITAACLVMPRNLFVEVGQFDEAYINGYEDVDLCARLCSRGFRFTVNPKSSVIHAEGQTPGRKKCDQENFTRLRNSSARFFKPDLPALLAKDGLSLRVSEYCSFQIAPADETQAYLNSRLPQMSGQELEETLLANIYWEEGWKKLLHETEGKNEFLTYFRQFFSLFPNISNAAWAMRIGRDYGDKNMLQRVEGIAFLTSDSPEEYLKSAEYSRQLCIDNGLWETVAQFDMWIDSFDRFRTEIHPGIMDFKNSVQKHN